MMFFTAETHYAVEELKMFLEVDSLDEIKKSWINFIWLWSSFNESQILTDYEVPYIENLITWLLGVPTLRIEIFKNLLSLLPWFILSEKETVTLEEGVVVESVLNVHIAKEWFTPNTIVTLYMAFLKNQQIWAKVLWWRISRTFEVEIQ